MPSKNNTTNKTRQDPTKPSKKSVKKPVVIIPKNQKTLPSRNYTPKEVTVDTSKLSKNKEFLALLEDAIAGIEIDTEDLDEEMLAAWEDFDDEIRPKLLKKNWALWAAIFSPVILPGLVKGMRSEPTVPQPKVIIKGRQQEVTPPTEPRKIVDYASEYFKNHGLELCKSLTETDLARLKDDLKNNWGKGPDAFAEAFKESYPVSKSRLETIYRSERHMAEYYGVQKRAEDAGHSYKQYRAVGDERSCDLCMSFDMEIKPIDEPFSNGNMGPSSHPNCRCSMITLTDDEFSEMPDEQIYQDASYLNDVAEQLKLNYKCEFNGTDNTCPNSIPSTNQEISLNPKIRKVMVNDKNIQQNSSLLEDVADFIKLNYKCRKEDSPDGSNKCNIENTNENTNQIKSSKPSIINNKVNISNSEINELKSNEENIFSKLNNKEISLVKEYTSTLGYNNVNKFLKGFPNKNGQKTVDILDKIINDSNLPNGIRLWKGINLNNSKYFPKKIGTYVTFKNFISTSASLNTARYFSNMDKDFAYFDEEAKPLIVELNFGNSGKGLLLSGNHTKNDSYNSNIYEVLLPRNQTFRIKKYEHHKNLDICILEHINDSIISNKQNSTYLSNVASFIKQNRKCKAGTYDNTNACGPEKESINTTNKNNYNNALNKSTELFKSNPKLTKILESYDSGDVSNKLKAGIIDKSVEDMDYLFNNVKLSESINLYSGLSEKSFEKIPLEVGSKFTIDTFVSATPLKDVASNYSRARTNIGPYYNEKSINLINIQTKEGDPFLALPIGEKRLEEKEFMGDRGLEFKVIGYEEVPTKVKHGKKTVTLPTKILHVEVNDKHKQNSSYLSDVADFMKLNYKCRKEDSPDGSNKCQENARFVMDIDELDFISPLDEVADFLKLNKKCKAGTFDDSNKCGPEKENKDDITILDTYREKGFTDINTYLRNNTSDNPIIDSNIKKIDSLMEPIKENTIVYRGTDKNFTNKLLSKSTIVSDLDNAFNASWNDPDRILSNKSPDNNSWKEYLTSRLSKITIPEKGYMSTSKNTNAVDMFVKGRANNAKVNELPSKLIISVPKGTPAIDVLEKAPITEVVEGVGYLSSSQILKQEEEILINRNTSIEIVSADLKKSSDNILYLELHVNIKPSQSFQEVSSSFNPELGGFHTTDYKTTNDNNNQEFPSNYLPSGKLINNKPYSGFIFHGTDPASSDNIKLTGFRDTKMANLNGVFFGTTPERGSTFEKGSILVSEVKDLKTISHNEYTKLLVSKEKEYINKLKSMPFNDAIKQPSQDFPSILKGELIEKGIDAIRDNDETIILINNKKLTNLVSYSKTNNNNWQKDNSEKSIRVISQDKADNPKLLEAIKDIDVSKLPSQFMVMKMKAGTPAKYYTKTDSIGVDKSLSSSEMTTEIKKVLESMKTNSSYLEEVTEFIKLNYRCEFNGTDYKCDNIQPSKSSGNENHKVESIITNIIKDKRQKLISEGKDPKWAKIEMRTYDGNLLGALINERPSDEYKELAKQYGIKETESLNTAWKLIHDISKGDQDAAREQVYEAFSKGGDVKKALELQIEVETRAFKDNPRKLYRKGGYHENTIESYTTDPEGANMTWMTDPDNKIGTDFGKHAAEFEKDGWKVLTGINTFSGYVGEDEVVLINMRDIEKGVPKRSYDVDATIERIKNNRIEQEERNKEYKVRTTPIYENKIFSEVAVPKIPSNTIPMDQEKALDLINKFRQEKKPYYTNGISGKLAKEIGFDKQPVIVSSEQANTLVDEGGLELIARQSRESSEQLKVADYFPTTYDGGYQFETDIESVATVTLDAKNHPGKYLISAGPGVVFTRAILSPSAKIIDKDELRKQSDLLVKEWQDKGKSISDEMWKKLDNIPQNEFKERFHELNEQYRPLSDRYYQSAQKLDYPDVAAMVFGYDAIRDGERINVINRGALYVQQEDIPISNVETFKEYYSEKGMIDSLNRWIEETEKYQKDPKQKEEAIKSYKESIEESKAKTILLRDKLYGKQKHNISYLQEAATYLILQDAAMKLNRQGKCKKGTVDDTFKCSNEESTKESNQEFAGFKVDYNFAKDNVDIMNVRRSAFIDVVMPELQQKLNSLAQQTNNITTTKDKKTIADYSSINYSNINEYLTNRLRESTGKYKSEDTLIELERNTKKDVEKLDNIFKKSNLSENLVTFRGLREDIFENDNNLRNALDTPGSEINFKCFTSTSILPFVAENFTGYDGRMLEIQLPKGSKAIYMAGVSLSPSEFEVLINRDTKYEVVGTKTTKIINPYREHNDRYIKVTTLRAIV